MRQSGNGVVEAYKTIGTIRVPVIVRLQGTMQKKLKKIIDNSGLEVFSAISFREAAELVTKILKQKQIVERVLVMNFNKPRLILLFENIFSCYFSFLF